MDKKTKWITVNGNHIPLKNGQTPEQAINERFNGKNRPSEEIVENQKYNKEMQNAENQNADMSEAFDDDYEEEFKEPSPEDEKQYIDKIMADIADASDKNAFEYVSDNIDELTEAGLISDETSDKLYAKLDEKIDEAYNDDKDLIDAVNNADDDILDEQFGKDTPERKLVGAMKGSQSNNVDERDNLKTGDTAYYNGKKVIISTSGLKDNELGGIQLKARDEDGHVYELSSRQLDKMGKDSSQDNNFKEYTDKNGEKVREFSSDKDAKKWFDEHQNELSDGTVLYGNKVYLGKDGPQENDDPIYSHFRKKFNVSDKELNDLRGHDYDRSTYKDNSKLTWRDPLESWADPVKDFAKEHNVSEDDVHEFLNRAYDRTNRKPLKDGSDVYNSFEEAMKKAKNSKKQSSWDMLKSAGYIDKNGDIITSNNENSSHDDINKDFGADLYNDYGMIAINPGVYGSNTASISVPNRDLSPSEEAAIERFVNNLGRKKVDFGNGPFDTTTHDGKSIVRAIRKYRMGNK